MTKPCLVIVHGAPATGKTTIARHLAESLNLLLFTKDDIKEKLFDALGWSDRAWSRKMGTATYSILLYAVEQQLRCGGSMVIESNFNTESDPIFMDLSDRLAFDTVQVICEASPAVVLERYTARHAQGLRHPGHVDPVVIEELRSEDHFERTRPLSLGGEVIEVDTDDFEKVDLEDLVARVSKILGPRVTGKANVPEQ